MVLGLIKITNDTSDLNGSLLEMKDQLIYELGEQGVTASYDSSTGLLGLIHKIADIQTETILFEDDCSTDKTTDYGSSITLRESGTSTIAYNSNGYYTITNNVNFAESFIPITPLTGLTDNFILEYDSYVEGNGSNGGSSGLVIYNTSTSWAKLTDDANNDKRAWYGYNNGSFHELSFYLSQSSNQKWIHYTYIVKDNSFLIIINDNDTVIGIYSTKIQVTRNNTTKIGLDSEWFENTVTRYKNIKVKAL